MLRRLLDDPRITSVRTIARRALPEHAKLRHVVCDLRSPEARSHLSGVDVLWHLAFQLWRTGSVAEMESMNVGGSRNLLAASPRRIVLASSASVYGAWPDNPLPIDETHIPRPNRECVYAIQKLFVESLCADVAPTAVLRISAVLGPTMDPAIRKATLGLRRGVPAMRGVSQAVQFLDEEDAARALHEAGLRDVTGPVNIGTADWMNENEIAAVAGARVIRLPRRAWLLLSEAGFRLRLLPFGVDRASLMAGPLAMSIGRAEQALRWRPTATSKDVLSLVLSRS